MLKLFGYSGYSGEPRVSPVPPGGLHPGGLYSPGAPRVAPRLPGGGERGGGDPLKPEPRGGGSPGGLPPPAPRGAPRGATRITE